VRRSWCILAASGIRLDAWAACGVFRSGGSGNGFSFREVFKGEFEAAILEANRGCFADWMAVDEERSAKAANPAIS